jgi:hypothetical protein
MIIVGGVITFGIAPMLRRLAPKEGERPSAGFRGAQKRLGMLSGLNMILGMLVLYVISLI